MSFLHDLGNVCKAVVHSPITKIVAGGIAIIAPPVGGPALAAIAAADKVTTVLDKAQATMKQAKGVIDDARGGVNDIRAAMPGGRAPIVAAAQLAGKRIAIAKQAQTAANVVKTTSALAQKGDKNAARNLQLLKIVQKAKAGHPQAQALVHQEIKKQVKYIFDMAKKPNATKEEKILAEATGRLIKATLARKKAVRNFAVDRRSARIVRVA